MSTVEAFAERLPAMVDDLAHLVSVESPSRDLGATAACAAEVSALGQRLLGVAPSVVEVDGRTHLHWTLGGRPRVLVLGHLDTVWPLGTAARWPFEVDGDRATGPGVFDMKAGIVMAFHALAEVSDRDGVDVLITSDEELGSPTSRGLVEDAARGLEAAFVLEPSSAGRLKVGRKGGSWYRVVIEGRAAHAGLDPDRGANALIELAHQVLAVQRLAQPRLGTTVTPTVASAGTTPNVVPASAHLDVDVRATSTAEQLRVDEQMRALRPVLDGTRVSLEGGPNRPPLPASASDDLFARARALADGLGLEPPEGVSVGGGSDGNLTAAVGCPTLDGLGAIGDGAHAEGEHIVVSAMPARTALVAALIADVLSHSGAGAAGSGSR